MTNTTAQSAARIKRLSAEISDPDLARLIWEEADRIAVECELAAQSAVEDGIEMSGDAEDRRVYA